MNSTEHVNHDPLAKVGTIDLQHSEHRNVDFTSLAGSMRRRGLPADHIHDALSAINKRLKRPLPSREIRAIAASIGNKPTSITPAIKLSSAFELVSDQSAPQWLLRPYLEQNVVAVLTGDFGTFKSFLALDWALHIAAGKPWHNDPSQSIPQHAVVFISAEGRGLSQRIRAWITHHFPNEPLKRVARRLKFRALEAPINLSELEQIDLLRNAIDALGVSPVLLIIDTLAKNSRDVEETNAKMQTFLNNINEHIRAPYKCTILLIHHVGHNKLRARGPSTLIASTDASFMVEKIDRWNIRLINERLKDSDSAPPLNLQAREISLGANGESDKVTSLVLVSGDKPIHIRRRPSSQTQIELLTRLESESKRSGVKSWTTQELNEIGRACIADRRRLLEARNGLRKAGWLSQREDKWLLMT